MERKDDWLRLHDVKQTGGSTYIGATSDLEGRTWEHKNKVHPGFTKRYNLPILVWFEQHTNIVLAIQREIRLKEYKREWKIKLIEGFNPNWNDLSQQICKLENYYKPEPGSRLWENYN